jgi:hypothetical protein
MTSRARMDAVKKYALALFVAALSSSPAAAAQNGSCEAQVTGAVNTTVKGKPLPDDAPLKQREAAHGGATTDYWSSLADIQMQTANIPADKLPLSFGVSCSSPDFVLVFKPTEKSTRGTVPFKPKSYPLFRSPATQDDADKQPVGSFIAQVISMQGAAQGKPPVEYFVSEPGTLEFTQLDAKGMAGKFSFKARQEEGPKGVVSVSGVFSFSCAGVGDKCQ